MSSSTRTSSKGGKTKPEKIHKTDKIDTGKSSGDKHVSKESSKSDENLRNKVQQLMETTQRSEEEVCLALHECNYDMDRAANMLYETLIEGVQWSVQRKKTRQPSSKQDKQATDEAPAGEEWNENQTAEQKDNKPRSKSGGPGHRRYNGDSRGGEGGGRGWRGREKQENERNLDLESGNRGGEFGRERRGRPGGSGRGGGRGGRGGGRGGRYQPRGGNRNNSYNKPIDTWDNNNSNTWDNSTAVIANTTAEENWDEFPGTDEWSTEEYTGSLADTKVFTPSAAQVQLEAQLENQHEGPLDVASQQLTQTLQINQQQQQPGPMPPQSPVPQKVGTLNAAQTKYLNQLTQQNTDKYGSMQTFQATTYEAQQYIAGVSQGYNVPQSYGGQPSNTYVNSSYPVTSNYSTTPESVPSQQPMRTKTQRARVPPPSKIPASAVEMPGDLNSSIGYLDVQFGAMDFMSDGGSFEGVVDPSKYVASTNSAAMENVAPANATNMDLSNQGQNANLDAYSPKNSAQSSITSALTQSLPSVENIPTSEHVSGAVSYSVSSRTAAANAASQSSTPQAVLDMNKQPESHSYNQNPTYSYQSKNYNSTYNGSQTTASSYQATNSYVNSQSASYNNPSTGNSFQNSYSSATSYQSNSNSAAFPSITQANSYPGTNQSYSQNANQSVYGANAGLNNSSNYGNTASTAPYNNYSSATNKLKEAVYDGTGSGGNSQATTSSSIASSSTAPLTHSQTTVSSTKTTTTLAKNSNNVVSNLPPGVAAPVMSTPYNMVQLPYFQQPLYSYEDVQILQQRLPPHMTTPFYDMSYQTPTTLAAVRDAALGNVGYSISSDGRFARGDNNASPVPSTLGQQTSTQAGHQAAQPMLAGATAAPYFFTTHFNTIPNYPFYLPAATNAHGTNSSSQYPKPGGYSSGYGAYDALSQTQEYSKGTYVGNAQGQKGTGGAASTTGSTGNDLPIYGKSHNALGKVNSYEKQGFHSGTPPPFTGTLHGSQSAGLAPSGTGYVPPVYIPAMAPQHHSTQLMHQPLHQESGNNSGQRSQSSNQAKVSGKQYPGSYWNQS